MSKYNVILAEEIEFVKSNTDKTAQEIASLLNRHPVTIRKLCIKNNIKIKRNSPKSNKINNSFFKNESANMFYILGFIAADGCIIEQNRNGLSLEIGLSIKDKAHLEKMTGIMGFTGKLYYKKSTNAIIFSIGSREICEDLQKYGITPRKSLTLKFPTTIPEKYLFDFIRGYFDGDGTCRIRKGYITKQNTFRPQFEFSILGTKDFLEQLKHSFNMHFNNQYGSILYQKEFNIYRLTFGGTVSAEIFGSAIYEGTKQGLFLGRKKARFDEWIKIKNSICQNVG